jgi:hypothetical protein
LNGNLYYRLFLLQKEEDKGFFFFRRKSRIEQKIVPTLRGAARHGFVTLQFIVYFLHKREGRAEQLSESVRNQTVVRSRSFAEKENRAAIHLSCSSWLRSSIPHFLHFLQSRPSKKLFNNNPTMEVASPITFGHATAGTKRHLPCTSAFDKQNRSPLAGMDSSDDYMQQRSFKRRRFAVDESMEGDSENSINHSSFLTHASHQKNFLPSSNGEFSIVVSTHQKFQFGTKVINVSHRMSYHK